MVGLHCRNWERSKSNSIARIHHKIACQRNDFLHKRSRQIANDWDCAAIETLDMKAMQKALKFGKSVSDNAWGKFTTYLQYKLEEQGKQLIKIDKWFASSWKCSVCGMKKKELALSERTYICECGNVLDRDINAAINIREEAIRLLKTA